MKEYDIIIVGAGTAGQTGAYELREKGLKVAVVDNSDSPGGVCALYGCQPKKWFYEITESIAKTQHLKGKGIVSLPNSDWSSTLQQKNKFTAEIPEGTLEGFKEDGIDFFEGSAKFLSPDSLEVDGKPMTAKFYILATGANPMTLPIKGSENIITSNDFLDLKGLPRRMVFVGGGFISFEFAHFAARMGPENSRITILEVADRPLGPFDQEMVDLLIAASKEEGIEVHSGVQISSVEKRSDGFAVITDSEGTIEADLVIHGAGRAPNLEGLDLEAGGVTYTKSGITVDDAMRTSNERVFAIGDCAATIQLARVADYEAYVAAENVLAGFSPTETRKADYRSIPAILFTYPQYGMVGKTEAALKKEGIVYEKSFGKNLSWPTYTRIGMKHAAYKILVGEHKHILGAHFLSDNPSGMINTIKMAMVNGITADELYWQNIMTPYPTRESDLIYMLEPFL